MSQEDISELTHAIKEMKDSFYAFRLALAESNTKQEMEIDYLKKSDAEQWAIIREAQTRMMKLIYIVVGLFAIMKFWDLGPILKDILLP